MLKSPFVSQSQPRSRRAAVTSVLATLVVGVLFVALVFRERGDGRDAVAADFASASLADASVVSAITSFATFTAEQSAGENAAIDHTYTAAGVRRLAAVIESLATRGDAVLANDAVELRTLADSLQRDPNATDHAEILRDALVIASSSLADVQRARFESLASAAAELRKTGEQLDPNRPLLSQMQIVQSYFEQASDLLRAMSEIGL